MRGETEMMDLILDTAQRDERIRAVFLNGSRTNENVKKDLFQDFDVVYLVRDLASFLKEFSWLRVFGEELIFQFPDKNDQVLPNEGELLPSQKEPASYGILMQFQDGNRIDLTLRTEETLSEYLSEDKLTVLLLDKDQKVPLLPVPTDQDYWVKPPTAEEYRACCNEFYWVSNYAAKGLWRRELPYAHEMLDHYVRDMLLKMLSWRAGVLTGFCVSVGKCGKYLEKYLPEEEYARMCKTYAGGEYEAVWDALFEMHALFRDCAVAVGEARGFVFPQHWHDNVTGFCEKIRALPPDAQEF